MRIRILDLAERDLIEGFRFYEAQEAGLGSYFLTNLSADIESLKLYAGIHEKPFKAYYRLLSRRFPFAVFYTFVNFRLTEIRTRFLSSLLEANVLKRRVFLAIATGVAAVVHMRVKLNQ